MAGNYSGNLVRTYARPDDPTGNWWPDASHNARGHEADGTDQYPEEHQVPAATGAEYAGAEFPNDVTTAPGILLANPSLSHDGPAILRPVYSDDQFREWLPGAHGPDVDRGHVGSQYAAPGTQARGEVYKELLDEGNLIPVNPNTEGTAAANLKRGINAYPMNNPEREGYTRGVRPGLFRRLFPDRDRRMHRRRYGYDLQPLTERNAAVPVNAPTPGAPMYGPVLDTWLPSWVGRRETQPALWRDPGTVDASLLAGSPATGGYDVTIGGEL